jgi:hypothetical protein
VLVGDTPDRLEVVAVAAAVGDRGRADDRRPLVDGVGETFGRDRAVTRAADVNDVGPAQLLGV